MTSITDLKLDDIKLFLSNNNITISHDINKMYSDAFDLMRKKSTLYDNVSDSIIEWMMAFNLLQSKVDILKYTKAEILSMSDHDLTILGKILMMKTTKVNHIINIFPYMRKLDHLIEI